MQAGRHGPGGQGDIGREVARLPRWGRAIGGRV